MSIVSTDTAIQSTADTTTLHESTLVQSFAESSVPNGPPDSDNRISVRSDTAEKVYIDFALHAKPKPARDPVDKEVNQKLALKQKELLYNLDQLRKKQIVLDMYHTYIKESSDVREFRRNTYLDKPDDEDQPMIELQGDDPLESTDVKPKLTKVQELDDYDIKYQYLAGVAAPFKTSELMNINDDMTRLCKMYLDAVERLTKSLPTDNIQERMYKRVVKQVREKVGEVNYHFSENSTARGSQMGSISMNSSQSFGSVAGSNGSSLRESSHGPQGSIRSDSTFSISGNPLKKESVAMQPEDLEITVEQACTNQLHLMNIQKSREHGELERAEQELKWQEFIQTLQSNTVVMSDIIAQCMRKGFTAQSAYDLTHRSMLVNLSQFFFDNVHQEERLAYGETNNFLKFFLRLSKDLITVQAFEKDLMGNVVFKDQALRQTVCCLFEGLTRRMPAFNYLRYVFNGAFNTVNIHQIDKDLRQLADDESYAALQEKKRARHMAKQAEAEAALAASRRLQQEEEKKQQRPEADTRSWARRQWDKLTSSNPKEEAAKKAKKEREELLKLQKQKEEKMKNQKKDDPKKIKKEKLYESMCQVYGDDADPLAHFHPEIKIVDENQPPPTKAELYELKMAEERVNNFQYVMDEYQFFVAQRSDRVLVTNSSLQRGNNASKSSSSINAKEHKDLTYHIKQLVLKNLDKILFGFNKTPYAIRAMLRVLVLRMRGATDFRQKVDLDASEIRLLSDILIAGWLNTGYRNPKSFGIQPSVDRELDLEYVFFRAARITFEHLMMMQLIPDKFVVGVDIEELNSFIADQSQKVKVYWQSLVNVSLSELEVVQKPQLIETCMVKIDDLELLYFYCTQAQGQVQTVRQEHWQPMLQLLPQMQSFIQNTVTESHLVEPMDRIIPENQHKFSLCDHFKYLLDLELCGGMFDENKNLDAYEYYCLFLVPKPPQVFAQQMLDWQSEVDQQIKSINKDFVTSDFQILIPSEKEEESKEVSQTQDLDAQTMSQKRHRNLSNYRIRSNESLQDIQEIQQILVSKHQKKPLTQPVVESTILQVLKLLGHVLHNKNLLFEPLRSQYDLGSHNAMTRDLLQIFQQAIVTDKDQIRPDAYLQMACHQIVRLLKKLTLEDQHDLQVQLLSHFSDITEFQIQRSREYLNCIISESEQLAIDVELFENCISNMKQFTDRFLKQLDVQRIISRQKPDVCLLECLNMPLDMTDDKKELLEQFRGVLLNLNCSQHSNALPVSCFMIFGGVNRRQEDLAKMKAEEEKTILMTVDQKALKDSIDKRKMIFEKFYSDHTKKTKYFQQEKADEFKIHDEQMKFLEKMVGLLTNQHRPHVKALIRCESAKYAHLIHLFDEDIRKKISEDYKQIKQEKEMHSVNYQDQLDKLVLMEPFDYFGIQKAYQMFLEHVSVITSDQVNIDYIDMSDSQNYAMQHHDFLLYDLSAKAIRYHVHDYMIKRIYKSMFASGQPTEMDKLVQELIMKKDGDPQWCLTSEESKAKQARGEKTDDFTETPEWCNMKDYDPSLSKLIKLNEAETPHAKALLIEQAVTDAMLVLQIVTPYKTSDKYGEGDRQRVMRVLMLETCKMYHRYKITPRLHSNLLFTLLFNVPQNEIMTAMCLKKWKQEAGNLNNQAENQKKPFTTVFTKLSKWDQQNFMLGQINTRNKVYEWFSIIKTLIREEQQRKAALGQIIMYSQETDPGLNLHQSVSHMSSSLQ